MPRNRSEKVDPPEVSKDGTRFWYRDGELHREGGPAIEFSGGTKFWYRDGKRHRDDGPAIECSNGYKSWYRDGQFIREEDA